MINKNTLGDKNMNATTTLTTTLNTNLKMEKKMNVDEQFDANLDTNLISAKSASKSNIARQILVAHIQRTICQDSWRDLLDMKITRQINDELDYYGITSLEHLMKTELGKDKPHYLTQFKLKTKTQRDIISARAFRRNKIDFSQQRENPYRNYTPKRKEVQISYKSKSTINTLEGAL